MGLIGKRINCNENKVRKFNIKDYKLTRYESIQNLVKNFKYIKIRKFLNNLD